MLNFYQRMRRSYDEMAKKIKIIKLSAKAEPDDDSALTMDDFREFLSAKTYEEQFGILLKHSEKNKKFIEIRRKKKMENYNADYAVSQEEITKQFEEFCHTKGIVAKFKVAFEQMGENARRQHEHDKANIEAVKNSEENKDFREFLHTKGFKAKCRLVIENIKRGAANANADTARKLDELHAKTQASICAHSVPNAKPAEYSAEQLASEFNAFLKERGLDEKYAVQIVEE